MKVSTEGPPLPIDGSPVTGGCRGGPHVSLSTRDPKVLTIHHHAHWDICYRGLDSTRSWSRGHISSLILIWYGTSNNEHLVLSWNLSETGEDGDALHLTHFKIWIELLAVWPDFHFPCISSGNLFTHQVNFTFTSETLAGCITFFWDRVQFRYLDHWNPQNLILTPRGK